MDDTSLSTTFVAPQVHADTPVLFTLTVDDGQDSHIRHCPDNDNRLPGPRPLCHHLANHIRQRVHHDAGWRFCLQPIPSTGVTGTIETDITGNATHRYGTAGDHTVRITGDFDRIYLGGNGANAAKTAVHRAVGKHHLGPPWLDSFKGRPSTWRMTADDAPDLSGVTDMSPDVPGSCAP